MYRALRPKRLYLRLFAPTDLDALARINSDPEVMRYIGEGKPVSREQTEVRLHAYIEHWRQHRFGLWAVVHKADQALIGFCGLPYLENTPEVEVGYRLAKRCWRMGLATEGASASLRYGFEALNLERIVAVVQAGHVASQRVLEKIGLRYEKDVSITIPL